MKECNQCHIKINTNQKYCPLCHQILRGENDKNYNEIYPHQVSSKKIVIPLIKKIITSLSIIAIAILIIINLSDSVNGYWAIIPITAVCYIWFLVQFGILSEINIGFRISLLSVLLVLLVLLIDYNSIPSNNGWSLNYLMSFILGGSTLSVFILMLIRKSYYRDYIFHLLILMLYSIIPIVLYYASVITIAWPALISLGISIFILLYVIIFLPKWIKEELHKRFHV